MRRFPLAPSLVLALAWLALPEPASAAWPHVPSVNLPVCSLPASNPQFHAAIPDGSGGAIVTWADQRAGASDVYAQHVLAAGGVDPAWPANGRAVCAAANYQSGPVLVSDGAGGAIVAWYDYRNTGSADVYAQHLLANGTVDPAWPIDGRALCTVTNEQVGVTIASDGAGGAIVAWDDQRTGAHDIYAHHVLASGAIDPAWPVDGRAVCTASGDQSLVSVVPDGAAGVVLAWQDSRTGTADIYAHHVRANGSVDPGWPVNGVAVCTAANAQQSPVVVADGSGGAIACWTDLRPGGNFDVYAQHVLAAGYVDGTWPADGRALCSASGNQLFPAIVADGAGGAFVAWDDRRSAVNPDIYALHVLNTGALDPAWPVDGRAVCAAAGQQSSPAIASDGGTGVLVSWTDNRNGDSNTDIFAVRVSGGGVVDPAWAANGNAISTATWNQQSSSIVADGAGGAIVSWIDLRTGAFGLYSQRVARHGVLGTPEPVIASVKDVPNDQGGKVKVSFDASWLDTDPSAAVDHYWILRSVPAAAATAALRTGATLTSLAGVTGGSPIRSLVESTASPRRLFATASAVTLYWELLSVQQALHIVNGYGLVAPTTGDSTGSNNAPTQFMVVAWNAAGTQYWASAPAGGYSVDNLPPYTPLSLIGSYGPGTTTLHWAPNADADLAHYRIYRGNSAGFVPGPDNRIASPADTGYVDAASGWFYKLSAVDTHGNESGWALLAAFATEDVGDPPATHALALRAPSPNPSASDLSLRFAVPREGRASLAVFDAAGRRVRQLLDGALAPGEHAVHWDGRDEAGRRLTTGLYFVRLTSGGRVLTQRVVRLE